MSMIILIVQIAACTGLGASLLWALKIDRDLGTVQLAVFGFALGLGVLGWLLFFLGINGWFTPVGFSAVLGLGVLGLAVFGKQQKTAIEFPPEPFDTLQKGFLFIVALVLLLDIPEGLAPPADGDTLAYHFAMAKQFLAAGRIEFVPRAMDGAAPLLVQMTYLPVLALGGERALTLWTMLSGWAAGGLLYVLCRDHLGRSWSLAVTLVYLTTPAVIYGGGSGQVEVRNALFVMLGAYGIGRTMDRQDIRYIVLAGLCAGFFMGGKYTGLLFAAAGGLALLWHRQWLTRGAIFSIVALGVGWQWYYWNALHTGDPVFPVLYGLLGDDAKGVWNMPHQQYFQMRISLEEMAVPQNIFWLLAYPFKATLAGANVFESGRTGMGPYILLILPFAAAGAWRLRHVMGRGTLLSYGLIAALYYVLWFFVGGSQRVRHLLPVLPLVLIVVSVGAERFVSGTVLRWQIAAIVGLTLSLQVAGQGLAALNPLRLAIGAENREQFLARNVLRYAPVPWLNANLGQQDKVLVQERTYLYYLDVPYYLAHQTQQALLDLRPQATDARRFLAQLEALKITHLLVSQTPAGADKDAWPPLMVLSNALDEMGCLQPVREFVVEKRSSRTLPGLHGGRETLELFRLSGDKCRQGG